MQGSRYTYSYLVGCFLLGQAKTKVAQIGRDEKRKKVTKNARNERSLKMNIDFLQ